MYLLILKQRMALCGERKYGVKYELCFPKKLVKLCRIINNEIHGKFKIDKHLSSEFEFNKDWVQEDAIAPLSFNITLEISIRKKVEIRINIFDKCTQIMAYAVDVVIMGMRLQDVAKVYTSLIEQKIRWN